MKLFSVAVLVMAAIATAQQPPAEAGGGAAAAVAAQGDRTPSPSPGSFPTSPSSDRGSDGTGNAQQPPTAQVPIGAPNQEDVSISQQSVLDSLEAEAAALAAKAGVQVPARGAQGPGAQSAPGAVPTDQSPDSLQ